MTLAQNELSKRFLRLRQALHLNREEFGLLTGCTPKEIGDREVGAAVWTSDLIPEVERHVSDYLQNCQRALNEVTNCAATGDEPSSLAKHF